MISTLQPPAISSSLPTGPTAPLTASLPWPLLDDLDEAVEEATSPAHVGWPDEERGVMETLPERRDDLAWSALMGGWVAHLPADEMTGGGEEVSLKPRRSIGDSQAAGLSGAAGANGWRTRAAGGAALRGERPGETMGVRGDLRSSA